MRRREFVTLLGAAAAWPIAGRSSRRCRESGFSAARRPPTRYALVTTFPQGLKEVYILPLW
jgi:hypothetical protein